MDIVAVFACPLSFAAVLALTILRAGDFSRTVIAAVFAGSGGMTALLPVVAHATARPLSPLATFVAAAFGAATLAGAWIAARILPRR